MVNRSHRERQIAYDARSRWKKKWIEIHKLTKQKYTDIRNFWLLKKGAREG